MLTHLMARAAAYSHPSPQGFDSWFTPNANRLWAYIVVPPRSCFTAVLLSRRVCCCCCGSGGSGGGSSSVRRVSLGTSRYRTTRYYRYCRNLPTHVVDPTENASSSAAEYIHA